MPALKEIIKNIVPQSILNAYFQFVEYAAAALYGFPSRRMIVIGVTGTKGKSTVVHLIGYFLEQAGYKVGWTSSVDFKVGDVVEANTSKMTMLGRFRLQRLFARMVRAGCRYVIVETSSEGLAQYRHVGIAYDIAVFTNLSPEHIERHGSFEAYKQAKEMLFASLPLLPKTLQNKPILRVSVVNMDSEHANDFLRYPADIKVGVSMSGEQDAEECSWTVTAKLVHLSLYGTDFVMNSQGQSAEVHSRLVGSFNAENILLASAVALSQGASLAQVQHAANSFETVKGRMERIDSVDGFTVFIDYAHEPKSLENVYQFCRQLLQEKRRGKLLCVLGAAGGGRDTWKRPVMGKLADEYCDTVILTNEDPYDENPEEILDEIASGFSSRRKGEKILDREQAIRTLLSLARKDDIVLLTGKGSEVWMMESHGKRTPWNEMALVDKLLKERGKK